MKYLILDRTRPPVNWWAAAAWVTLFMWWLTMGLAYLDLI